MNVLHSAALVVVMVESKCRVVVCERTHDVQVVVGFVQKVVLACVRTDVQVVEGMHIYG